MSENKSEPVITVGYWSIRGLGAPLRMMTMYAGVPLNAVCTPCRPQIGEDGKSTGWDMSDWFGSRKPQLKEENPLINLPFVRIGDGPLVTQTNACFTHLARHMGLLGSNAKATSECEQLLCEIMDVRNNVVGHAYGGDGSLEAAQGLLKKCAGSLGKLDAWLGKTDTKSFLVGETATAPDFHLWEMVDQLSTLCTKKEISDGLAAYPNLLAFHGLFAALPGNARYVSSPLASLPMNNMMACFGSAPGGNVYTSEVEYTWGEVGGSF